jgi:pimeloyl-ACP methyl ester carboxylesterase
MTSELVIPGFRRGTKVAALLAFLAAAVQAWCSDKPVRIVADHVMKITTPTGSGLMPIYISLDGQLCDFTKPEPSVRRALIIVHGLERNAEHNHRVGLRAIRNAGAAAQGTLLLGPQFLEKVDTDAHGLPGTVLRWPNEEWMGGANAENAAVSSYAVIDAVLAQLGDRRIFPNLKTVVLAGHSAGGQLVQRYAAVGRGGDALERSGIPIRYVVANPSSYLYFSPQRPVPQSKAGFTFEIPSNTCHGEYDHWKYGLVGTPPYVQPMEAHDVEQRYVAREIFYLLGTRDNDPHHPELDRHCEAEDEGPQRFLRGEAFFAYLQSRHPELRDDAGKQKLWAVPGVDHDNDRMFNSECGLAALFDAGTCTTPIKEPQP